jgi:pimeloyl-ACP methyl ester carboxylesterase
MRGYFNSLSTVLFLTFAAFGCSSLERKPDEAQPDVWRRTEMSTRRGSFFEADLKPGSPFCGLGFAYCTFDLHYFQGPPTKSDFRDKTILYIPGGPGDIVDRKLPDLDSWDIDADYIYFDVRGTGYSTIHESNAYDQFLRARYVVEDIEALRKKYFNECSKGEDPIETKCEQKRKPWDAIYAHSWGTIVAQMYARKYPKGVNALILSAPVSRTNADTGSARRAMIIDNLMSIYKRYSTDECSWPSDESMPKIKGRHRHPLSENFCFLKDKLTLIEFKLRSLLNQIEREYGSTAFAGRYYSGLIKEPDFERKYQYPAEFFKAIRWLEWFGAAEDEGFRFQYNVKQNKIDAAFFLGYYLTLKSLPHPIDDHGKKVLFECDTTAPFVEFISDRAIVRSFFCDRIQMAAFTLETDERNDDSLRAYSVFGIFDGLARWIFRLMEEEKRTDENNCFKVQDLDDIARDKLLQDKKTVQYVVKQIGRTGINSDEKICPWDPSRYRHKVPTLVLSGLADPVTAGGQSRDFYENGLAPGRRVLIEFPGVGHQMSPQFKVQKEPIESEEEFVSRFNSKFGSILAMFLLEPSKVDNFIKSRDLKKLLDEFEAHLWP